MLKSNAVGGPRILVAMAAGLLVGTPAVAQSEAAVPAALAKRLSNPRPMPSSAGFTGLSRKVLQYSEAFALLMKTAHARPLTEADWAPVERIVDTKTFRRVGVFTSSQAEEIGWPQYKTYISRYGAGSTWEGTLRHITEKPGRVIMELEERTGPTGPTGAANTVTIYEFNKAGKLARLDVYVMPLNQGS